MVLTIGTPLGPVLPDYDTDAATWWGGEQPSRASGYRIAGALIADDGPVHQALAARFGIPVNVGLDLASARALQHSIGTLA
ncbi:hypothetical protein DVB87_16380 [Tsukamurella tyrosinosolvens]|nr:hypothetical protein DVB87_16380 [Tsukamurella tyrosinosolvens]